MYPYNIPVTLSLLLTSTIATAIHDPYFRQNTTTTAPLGRPSNKTTTRTVTVTHTSYITNSLSPIRTPLQSNTPSYTPALAGPQPTVSVTVTTQAQSYTHESTAITTGISQATLTCGDSMEPCVTSGIPVWSFGTTSFVLSPLTSTMQSETTSDAGDAWGTRTMSMPTSYLSTISRSVGSGFEWPSRPTEDGKRGGGGGGLGLGETETGTLTLQSSSSVFSQDTVTSVRGSQLEVSGKMQDAVYSGLANLSTLHPANLGWATKPIDVGSCTRMHRGTPSSSKKQRAEESKAAPRRASYWSRFFAAGDAVVERRVVQECLACDTEGKVTCLPHERYTWCRNGCAMVEDLGCDMVCEGDGRIRKEGNYCVR